MYTGHVLQAATKLELLASACLFLFAGRAISAQQPPPAGKPAYIIERLEIVGNRRVPTDKLWARMTVHSGDTYSVETVQREVRALWNTGFFDDVRSEVADSPSRANGKIVIFIVQEKPIIAGIDFRGIKSITEPDIRAALKNQKIELSVGDWFDQSDLKRAANVITQLLASRGYQSATVEPTYEGIASSGTVTIEFHIHEGPKIKK